MFYITQLIHKNIYVDRIVFSHVDLLRQNTGLLLSKGSSCRTLFLDYPNGLFPSQRYSFLLTILCANTGEILSERFTTRVRGAAGYKHAARGLVTLVLHRGALESGGKRSPPRGHAWQMQWTKTDLLRMSLFFINQRLKICLLNDYFPNLCIYLSCTNADIKYFKIKT